MIAKILARVFGTANQRALKHAQSIVAHINAYEPEMMKLSDQQIRAKTDEFRAMLSKGKTLDDILPQAYALVREASRRTIQQRPFDVQLIGAIALHEGKIAEMKTGEGKSLTATLALYLNALGGKGVHLVTVNDYLARLHAELFKPIYDMLGVSVAVLQNDMSDEDRIKAYQADILYATNNELGFDYLRDNMKFRLEDYVQKDLTYAIVDEIDSILIDEARTPLIISGSSEASSKLYDDANAAILRLKDVEHYEVDHKERTAHLTEAGIDIVEHAFGIKNLYAPENLTYLHHAQTALKAHALFKKDVDYVVRDGEVLIVDEFTGRILMGRRYSDGLHQALEAKEHVQLEAETQTLASITLQNYFRLYKKLAGMTGTAATEAEEFYRVYKLDILTIPTHMPMIREDKSDLIFLTKAAKYRAIAADVKERYKKKQPVLIGTVAIETSEYLSAVLRASGIPHDVLNAKQHEREGEIIASAGQPGRVTIATNMAGRGTDIKLTPESVQAGGLYVLGTERHEARRIDNQLRGRSGRQGDPGESRFYISLEDELIRNFAGDSIKNTMQNYFKMTEDDIIESKSISKRIEAAQEKVEKRNSDIRKHILEYDDVLNQQRTVVYSYRRSVLEGAKAIFDLAQDFISEAIADIAAQTLISRKVEPAEKQTFFERIADVLNIKVCELEEQKFPSVTSVALQSDVLNYVLMRYVLFMRYDSEKYGQPVECSDSTESKNEIISQNNIRSDMLQTAQRWLMLEFIDEAWKQHMLNLDQLKEGIGLRGWGQKNPLIEYKREAFAMFIDMMRSVRYQIAHSIFRIDVQKFDEHALEIRRRQELERIRLANMNKESSSPRRNPQKRKK
ncbi:MAG: Protein translocase subunit SecA [candidate division TM6 bacterium GW2011_GWE2_41_16]|nr:MAG: Protein translocase subunit SecA [candidate division TM6 bacterium GW2011_GWE2_41_16]